MLERSSSWFIVLWLLEWKKRDPGGCLFGNRDVVFAI